MSDRWICINRKQQFEKFLDLLWDQDWVAADTETTGLVWFRHDICGLSFSFDIEHDSVFATKDGEVDVYIPIRHTTGEKQLKAEHVLVEMREFFARGDLTSIWHHAKFDELMLRSEGVEINGTIYDTLGQHKLLNSGGEANNYKLNHLAHILLGAPKWKDAIKEWLRMEARRRKCKISELTFADVPIETMTRYAAQDTRYTWLLFWEFIDDIDDNAQLAHLFYDVEMPLTPILADMEYGGALLDVPYLLKTGKETRLKAALIYDKINRNAADFLKSKQVITDLNDRLVTLQDDLDDKIAIAGPTKRIQNSIASTKKKIEIASSINVNSPKQLREYFEYLDIPVIKKTATEQMSTNKLVLMRLASTGQYPEATDILDYRNHDKLDSTFITGICQWLDGDNWLHTNYNQYGAVSGRLSSSSPNLHNIPRGPVVRKAFILPDKDFVFVSIDFSQIELRLAAHFSGDGNMLDIYQADGDIHQRTADMLGCPTRQHAKPINFGLLYGMGITSLIDNAFKDYNVAYTKKQAERYYKLFWSRAYPGLREWVEDETDKIRSRKYADTFFGRRRYELNVTSRDVEKWLREKKIRGLINHIIQGTAADIMKITTVRVAQFLKSKGAKTRIFLNIHDELCFYWHKTEFHLLQPVKDIMEDWDSCNFDIPIKVDISYSPTSWGDKQELRI